MCFGNSKLAQRLLNVKADGLDALRAWVRRQHGAFERLGPTGKAQWLEFVTLLAGYLLSTQGDRMSFAHGVENRCPFLDLDVVTWANSLPVEMRLRGLTEEKHILKKTFADALPRRVIEKPKRPYQAPDVAAFVGDAKPDYLEDALAEAELRTLGVVDVKFALRFVGKLLSSASADISPRESHAFVFLLSLVFLDRSFVRRDFSRRPNPAGVFVKEHDGRDRKR